MTLVSFFSTDDVDDINGPGETIVHFPTLQKDNMREASWLPVATATLGALLALGHALCTLPVSVSSLSFDGNTLSSRQRFTSSWGTTCRTSKFQRHSHKEDAAAAASATAAAADYSSSLADALRQNNGSKSPPPDAPSPFSYNGHLLFTGTAASITPATGTTNTSKQAVDSEEEEDDDSYPPGSAAADGDGSNSPSMRSRLADKLRKLTGAAAAAGAGSTATDSSSPPSTWETSSTSSQSVDSDLEDMNIQVKQGLYQIKSKEQHEYVGWFQSLCSIFMCTLGPRASFPHTHKLSHTLCPLILCFLPHLCCVSSIEPFCEPIPTSWWCSNSKHHTVARVPRLNQNSWPRKMNPSWPIYPLHGPNAPPVPATRPFFAVSASCHYPRCTFTMARMDSWKILPVDRPKSPCCGKSWWIS
jgi:hypothetical protein